MLYISFNYRELHRLKEAVFAPHMVNAGFTQIRSSLERDSYPLAISSPQGGKGPLGR